MQLKTPLNSLFERTRGRVCKRDFGEIDKLLSHLKNPEKNFPSIHIAGTNGKGSCAHKLAAGYEAGGYKVGLFTSPHILKYSERIRINGVPVDEEKFERTLTELLITFPKATFFEITTALGFNIFAEEKVDIAIVETGLGGKFDATNRLNPCFCIVTNIGLEHQDILGETLEEIAGEKLGILKENIPFILGPTIPTHLPKLPDNFKTFNDENNALVLSAFKTLQERFPLSSEAISMGLFASAPLRLQKFNLENATYYIDVAHNPPALKRSFEMLSNLIDLKKLHVFFKLAPEKDPTECEKVIPNECIRVHNLCDFKEGTLLIIGSFRHISEMLNTSNLKNLLSI